MKIDEATDNLYAGDHTRLYVGIVQHNPDTFRNDPCSNPAQLSQKSPIEMFAATKAPAKSGTTAYETADLPKDGHGKYFSELPEAYSLPYDSGNNAVCFANGCHDRTIETRDFYQGTNFRNAGRNLHYRHVRRSPRGLNCRACHTGEETDQEMMMRGQVPYKEGMLPVKYRKGADGGSCVVGCHRELAYYRVFNFDW